MFLSADAFAHVTAFPNRNMTNGVAFELARGKVSGEFSATRNTVPVDSRRQDHAALLNTNEDTVRTACGTEAFGLAAVDADVFREEPR